MHRYRLNRRFSSPGGAARSCPNRAGAARRWMSKRMPGRWLPCRRCRSRWEILPLDAARPGRRTGCRPWSDVARASPPTCWWQARPSLSSRWRLTSVMSPTWTMWTMRPAVGPRHPPGWLGSSRAGPGSGAWRRRSSPWSRLSRPPGRAGSRCPPSSAWPAGGTGMPMSWGPPAARSWHHGCHGPPVASAVPGAPRPASAPASRRRSAPGSPWSLPRHRSLVTFPTPMVSGTSGGWRVSRLPGQNGPGPGRRAVRYGVPRPVRAVVPAAAEKIHGRPVTEWSGRRRCRSRSISRLAARPPVIRSQAGFPPPGAAVGPPLALSSASALRATPTTCTPASRSMRRTPMVCRWARRTSRATVRSTPPLDVIA